MASISISFNAESVESTPNSYNTISVYASGVDTKDLLNEIGADESKEHFNLVDEKELEEANERILELEEKIKELETYQ